MKKLWSYFCVVGVLLTGGCGGGGATSGGESASPQYTFTLYQGITRDSKYGDFKISVTLDQSNKYAGRIGQSISFNTYDSYSKREGTSYLFNYFYPAGTNDPQNYVDQSYVPFHDHSFSATMATWPDNTPAYNNAAAICHVDVDGTVSSDLIPGSVLTLSYKSSDCSFISTGVVQATYVNKETY